MSRKKVFGAVIFVLAAVGMFLVFQYIGTPLSASAHGGGKHLEVDTGPYTVRVELEGQKIVQYGFSRFNLDLLLATTTDVEVEIPHDAIWARIEHDKDILFAGWLYKPDGLQGGFSYSFQEAGDYVMTVRFNNASGTIAEGAVNLSVEGSGISESHIAVFLFGLVIGGILILSLGRQHMFGNS
jgi:hypothetical protein